MSVIITHVDTRSQLTVHTIEGHITDEDIITTIAEYYRGTPTANVVWDFTDADVTSFNEENIQVVVKFGKRFTVGRAGGKTALVLPDDLKFGLGRMAEAYAELLEMDLSVRSFRTLVAAKQWLGIMDR